METEQKNKDVKIILVRMVVGENNIQTDIESHGLSQGNIHDLLEMEAMFENAKQLIHSQINTKSKFVKKLGDE